MPPSDPTWFPPDEQNPYAPPRADVELEPVSFDPMPMRFSIDNIVSRSWEIYRERMGLCISMLAVYLAITIGLVVLSMLAVTLAQNAHGTVVALLGFAGYLTFILISFWLALGLVHVMVDIARGREVTIGGLFGGGRFLGRTILAAILFALAMLAAVGAAATVGAIISVLLTAVVHANPAVGIALMFLGVFAGYIAALFVALRLSQFIYLVVDRDAGVLDSLRGSFRITQGHVGVLFVISLMTGLINILGMMACGVGVFFTTPYIVLLNVVAYLALVGQSPAGPPAKGELLTDLEPI